MKKLLIAALIILPIVPIVINKSNNEIKDYYYYMMYDVQVSYSDPNDSDYIISCFNVDFLETDWACLRFDVRIEESSKYLKSSEVIIPKRGSENWNALNKGTLGYAMDDVDNFTPAKEFYYEFFMTGTFKSPKKSAKIISN